MIQAVYPRHHMLLTAALAAILLISARGLAALEIGQVPPPFMISSSQGESIRLADFRGRVVYLDLWASWCQSCAVALPWMSDLQKRFGPDKLQVIAINLDEHRANAEAALRRAKASLLVGYDPLGIIARTLAIRAIPTSYIISPDGTIVSVHTKLRESDRRSIEQTIEGLIGTGK